MKYIWILFLTLFIAYSCADKEKKTPEIVKDLDEIYLTKDQVSEAAELVSDNSNEIFINDFKKIALALDSNKTIFPLGIRVYIGKEGIIEKVKDIGKSQVNFVMNKYSSQKNKIFTDTETLTEKLIPTFSKIKYMPALDKSGNPVFYREDLEAVLVKNESGDFEAKINFDFNFNFSMPSDDEYLLKVEEMPTIIGGMKAIADKVRYPELARAAGIQGRVFIKAFIDEEGNVVKAEVIKGIGSGCDEAALQAVKETKFTPGRKSGKAVKTQVSIPILFQLQ